MSRAYNGARSFSGAPVHMPLGRRTAITIAWTRPERRATTTSCGEIIGAVEHLASDDIADLVPSLPPDVVLALLRALDRKDRTEVQSILI